MSINPVQPANFVSSEPPDRSDGRGANTAPSPEAHAVAPDSGSLAKTGNQAPQDAANIRESPQDEVQVQRDGQLNGEIVIKYLDGGGQVILQVPSSQVLNLNRSIAHDFEHRVESRPKSGAPQLRPEEEHTA
jgi:hypothetical protein